MNGHRAVVGAGLALIVAGGIVLGVADVAQRHAPQPNSAQAGSTGPAARASASAASPVRLIPAPPPAPGPGTTAAPGRSLRRSLPVAIAIPAISVHSPLLHVGLNPDGTIQVPPLNDPPLTNEAAWYRYSPTPGQPGPAVIEGHVDSARNGPSVFFRLGALYPGDEVDIMLADHQVAVFKITGVRVYPKGRFPTGTVYGPVDYPALRLVTCGGSFDEQTHQYVSNVVAFALLASAHRWLPPHQWCSQGGPPWMTSMTTQAMMASRMSIM